MLLGEINIVSSVTKYVGIPKRFVALSIDGLIYGFCTSVLFFGIGNEFSFTPKFLSYMVLTTIIHWAYFCLMESSSAKATLGKMALSIAVTDSNGKRISLKQATLRYLGKNLWLLVFCVATAIGFRALATGGEESPYFLAVLLLFIVSFLILIVGYLMAGFTPEKQALHDRIARTFVVDVSGQSRQFPQKALLQIAAIAVVSRLIFQFVPSTPVTPSVVDRDLPTDQVITPPSPTQSPSPIQSGNSSNTPFQLPNTLTLCGVRERVFPPSSVDSLSMNGVWKIQFSSGGVSHESDLRMQGDSGEMRTEFFNPETQSTKAVLQTIKLGVSPRGLWLLGFNPVNAKTQQRDSSYIPDNIFLQRVKDGSINAYNCDDKGNQSPANIEFVRQNT